MFVKAYCKGVRTLDESDFVIRIADMNDRINDAQNITASITSYQTAIDRLQDRIAELEHKIDLLTGPCICEPLL